MVHELTEQKTTRAPHAVEEFYLGPALDHYWCYQTWIPATRSERVANTIVWLPQHISVPKTLSADAAIATAQELIYALQNPHPASAFSPLQDSHVAALYELATIFKTAAPTVEDALEAPRVEPQIHIAHQQHPIGTRFTKLFAGVPYNGQVETFDVETKYYHVKYDDGDEGDQTEAEVTNLHKQSESDWTVVPGATPRVKFTPATYAGATRNQGQKR